MKLFNKYKFSDKSQTLGGTISLLMGLASLASLGYGIYLAFQKQGSAGLEVGSFALLSLMLAVIGTIMGLLSFREDDKFYTLSRVGSVLCGILSILMIAVFLMGLGI